MPYLLICQDIFQNKIENFEDISLTSLEKLVLSVISHFAIAKLGCVATNENIANKIGVSARTVAYAISLLKSKNIIESTLTGCRQRKITLTCRLNAKASKGGLIIQTDILTNTELQPSEKILLSLIKNLNFNKRQCFASNKFFAKVLNLSTSRVSQLLQELQNKGFLKFEYGVKRIIKFVKSVVGSVKNIAKEVQESVEKFVDSAVLQEFLSSVSLKTIDFEEF